MLHSLIHRLSSISFPKHNIGKNLTFISNRSFSSTPNVPKPKKITLKQKEKALYIKWDDDVEIKYPDTMTIEHNVHPVERNAYLDRIVQLVIDENQPERWLFFSSFDVDICHMIERKQPCYHAFLLSVGHPCRVPEDCNRLCPAHLAVEIAHEIGLLGVVTDSKAVLADNTVLTRAHEHGMKLLTYGSLNNNPSDCQKQIDLGVDSIISDYLKRIISGTHLPSK